MVGGGVLEGIIGKSRGLGRGRTAKKGIGHAFFDACSISRVGRPGGQGKVMNEVQ